MEFIIYKSENGMKTTSQCNSYKEAMEKLNKWAETGAYCWFISPKPRKWDSVEYNKPIN